MIRKTLQVYRELKAQFRFQKKRGVIGPDFRRFLNSRDKKPFLTILGDLIRITREYRCIPDQYFRYDLYRRSVPRNSVRTYVSRYTMEMKWFPVINNHFKHHPLLLNNKIFFKQYIRQFGFPVSEPIVYILNHTCFTPEMKKIAAPEALARLDACGAKRLFCKSDILDSALGITCFTRSDGGSSYHSGNTRLDLEYLETLVHTGGYLFERGIEQHPLCAHAHPASLNSFRVVTQYESARQSRILWTVFKMGTANSHVDNFITGGISVLIDPATGETVGNGFDIQKRWWETHPTTGIRFDELQFPFFGEVADVARRAADIFPTLPSIGWDIAYTEQGPVIIEGNDRWGLVPYQIAIGGIAPLIRKEWFGGSAPPR